MNKPNPLIALFPILLAMGSCTTKTSTPDYAKLEQEVRALFPLTVELFSNKDVEGLVNRFTPDGTLKITGNPIVAAHAALAENYSRVVQLEDFTIDFDIMKIEIAEAGDLAYAVVHVDVSFMTPGGPITDSGKSLLVLKRVNNQWNIAAENISAETPPPGA